MTRLFIIFHEYFPSLHWHRQNQYAQTSVTMFIYYVLISIFICICFLNSLEDAPQDVDSLKKRETLSNLIHSLFKK